MVRRLLQLYIGLVLYGVSTALFVHANLGPIRGMFFIWGSVSSLIWILVRS